MILIDVNGANAIVRKQDTLTSGMVGATVVFRFGEDWNSLAKTAVFRAGRVTRDALVSDSIAEIPHEVLAAHGYPLEIGVYGTAGNGSVVIPTVWAKTNPIKLGADPSGDESVSQSLPIWAQMQEELNKISASSDDIREAKEEMVKVIEEGKQFINETVAQGGFYTKIESGTNFAAAIRGKASGAKVVLSDNAPAEHTLSVKVAGKNLFNTADDFDKTDLANYTYVDGVLNISGSYASKWIKVETGKTYMFSADSTRTGSSGGGVYIMVYKENKVDYKLVKYDVDTLSPRTQVTASEGYPYIRIMFYGSSQSKADESATYTNIQLEEGTVATAYEPYIDPSTVTVTRSGKNLLNPAAVVTMALASNTTTGGNYILIRPSYRSFYIPCKPGDVFSLSRLSTANNRFRCVFTATEPAAEVTCFGGTSNNETYDRGLKIENIVAPENAKYFFVYLSNQADPIENIQVEYGPTATEYEAYVTPKTYTPKQNGSVDGVVSLKPGMALATDTAGVKLTVEYNRDINVVIKELLNKFSPAARIASVSLPASKWTGSGSLYSQVVSIAGITENSQVNLTPSVEQLSIFYDKDLTFITENDGGVVTVYVIGQKPQNDYTIQANIVEVIE